MKLTLSRRGLLHVTGRCRASHYPFTLNPDEELVAFIGLRFERFCRRCLGQPVVLR